MDEVLNFIARVHKKSDSLAVFKRDLHESGDFSISGAQSASDVYSDSLAFYVRSSKCNWRLCLEQSWTADVRWTAVSSYKIYR
jgi:hypothetical protein